MQQQMLTQSIVTNNKGHREARTLLPMQLRQEGPTSQLLGEAKLAMVLAVYASGSPAPRAVQHSDGAWELSLIMAVPA